MDCNNRDLESSLEILLKTRRHETATDALTPTMTKACAGSNLSGESIVSLLSDTDADILMTPCYNVTIMEATNLALAS
ncbi:hypothetical protein AWZ03_015419 [Drosophila navojoa]|uniref:Uncharacterized protein n=1 Tax=Drosophila navojoa TaxID=7232 RepID=A0A484AM86_DRONA|nr:hypothetical protein AWZ03_015419 [Drosophila navojoa]